MIGKLPAGSHARVEQKKVLEYLLNPGHPQGGSKANFFLARGFNTGSWQALCDALITQGRDNSVTKVTQTQYGTRYQVDCNCPTPDESNPCIRSIWEITAIAPAPRLLTAHPLGN
jgi:hypothetical protein